MNRECRSARRRRVWIAASLCLAAQVAAAALRPVPVPPPEAPAQPSAPAAEPVRDAGPAKELDEFYDRDNPAFAQLQRAREALGHLPTDRDGKVDWMAALRSQAITPRQQRDGAPPAQAPLDLDVIMRNTRLMPHVRFPHRAHTEWLACSNCHPVPFAEQAGSTAIRMEDIFRGRFCGMCHDRVAFITHRNCDRCHSVPLDPRQPGTTGGH